MRKRTAAIALAAVLPLAGCAGGEPAETRTTEAQPKPADSSRAPKAEPEPEPEPADGAGLREAVQGYSDTFLTAQPLPSYYLLSERCRDRYSLSYWTGLLSTVDDQYGTALPIRTFEADVAEGMARVTYTYDVAEINQSAEPWVLEKGGWRQDDC